MLALLTWVHSEYLISTLVVIPLLKKLFLICRGIPLDQILELGKIGSEQCTPSHSAAVEESIRMCMAVCPVFLKFFVARAEIATI
jgi:hypothetical protein